jgi:sterol desaturase/sphingolipid hydroxylase (fatty acid hydroxylase superfamily)
MIEFTENFRTVLSDHFLVYWGTCGLLFIVDCFLYATGLWKYTKLHSLSVPDTWTGVIKTVLTNQILVGVPMIYAFADCYTATTDWTTPLRMIATVLLFELFFYYTHRLLHVGFLYKYIHKIHHRWNYPLAISTFYAHPVEHAVANLLPVVLSAYIAGLPFVWARWWHILALANGTVVAHGGFRYSKNHDYHHAYVKVNYGALGILDWVHKTDFRYHNAKKLE